MKNFVAYFVVLCICKLCCASDIYVNALQSIRNIIGVILLLFSGWLAMSTLSIVFREVRETPTVIRKGAYRYCRHPMYLSELILYFALLVMSLSVAALVIWLVAIGFLYFICRYEEKLLLERFGDEYRSYMQEVPMWLPRIFPGKH